MKIGIVHTGYLFKGGEDVMVEQEYQLLKKHKVAVEVLYFKNSSNWLYQLAEMITAFYNPFSYRRISRWLATVKPDVVHIHNWHYSASPAVFLAAKKKGIPVVHTLHNFRLLCPSGTLLHNDVISSEYLSNKFPWHSVRSRAYRHSYLQTFWLASVIWFHKIIGTWKNVDKYIALTEHAKSIFLLSDIFTKEKIVVKPNFIANVPSEECERQSHFLFTGRLSIEKGMNVLLNAFAHSGHVLKIIGDGPLRNLVENYAKEHNNIIYLGFKHKNEIMNELKVCTAFIFSSIWYEGNPLTIIEALACGTAVITSGMGAMQTMITDGYNGLHFKPGSENDLIEKLNKWQVLPQSRKEDFYVNAKQSYIDNYTPEKSFEKLISIYKSVVNHGKTKPIEFVY